MATFRASLSFPMDSALPKDAVTINPHFNGTDAQALANALDTNLEAMTENAGKPRTIKIYDAATPPPSYPLATVTRSGTPPSSGVPRETAICCSYYSTYNRPRYRGRLYLPTAWFTAVVNVRPADATLDRVLVWFKSVFGTGLPPAHNLVVYSRVEKKSMGGVNQLWVDDEWDTQRKRGLRGTKRITATFPQAVPSGRPYSYRFIASATPAVWIVYTVPAGYRAVVKALSLCNTGTNSGNIWLSIAGVTVFGWQVPGAQAVKNEAMAQVAYAHEEIRLYLGALYFEGAVSGYLLDDIGPAPPADDQITYERFEEPTPLPAAAQMDEAERRRELIRAWLAGYWAAINEARELVDLPPLPLPTARPGTDSRQAGSGT